MSSFKVPGDSLPHGRVSISIALYPFRLLEVPQGEYQIFFFPKNEAETESWICFLHLSEREKERN